MKNVSKKAFALYLVDQMHAQDCAYEALDSTAAPTCDAKRRGLGWLAGQADIGWRNRIGWYEGFHLLVAVNPHGVITGFGFGAASTHDHSLATTLLAVRHTPISRLLSAGKPAHGVYIADKGFAGYRPWRLWKEQWQAEIVSPPHQSRKHVTWPKALHRWLASSRQIIETVNDKLLNSFRLARERPHDLTGFQARLSAKVALHTFCIWLNQCLGRPFLAFATLLDW